LAKGGQSSLKYEIIGRNFNNTEKSEQCSKVTRKLIESNKLGGGLEAEPQRCGDFYSFFQKKSIFEHTFSKFLLKKVFLNDCNVC